jgi:hypothetical protein
VGLAPAESGVAAIARKKRGLFMIALARDGARGAAMRHDLLEAAADLESIGEDAIAAEAYALAGDVAGEARALVSAGDVERLEEVLERDRARAKGELEVQREHRAVSEWIACGKRREALEKLGALAALAPEDLAIAESARALAGRRTMAMLPVVELRSRRVHLALGDEVTIGRTEGAITVSSPAVSRRHLVLARGEGGAPCMKDLGSRNGTELRGMRVAGALPVPAAGLEVKLGGEVPLRISRSEEIVDALVVDVSGSRITAPLGPARLGIGAWRLEAAPDGWVELVTDDAPPAYLAGAQIAPRTPLLAGDAITATRDGDVVLRVPGG